jgi:hypothetical protein
VASRVGPQGRDQVADRADVARHGGGDREHVSPVLGHLLDDIGVRDVGAEVRRTPPGLLHQVGDHPDADLVGLGAHAGGHQAPPEQGPVEQQARVEQRERELGDRRRVVLVRDGDLAPLPQPAELDLGGLEDAQHDLRDVDLVEHRVTDDPDRLVAPPVQRGPEVGLGRALQLDHGVGEGTTLTEDGGGVLDLRDRGRAGFVEERLEVREYGEGDLGRTEGGAGTLEAEALPPELVAQQLGSVHRQGRVERLQMQSHHLEDRGGQQPQIGSDVLGQVAQFDGDAAQHRGLPGDGHAGMLGRGPVHFRGSSTGGRGRALHTRTEPDKAPENFSNRRRIGPRLSE